MYRRYPFRLAAVVTLVIVEAATPGADAERVTSRSPISIEYRLERLPPHTSHLDERFTRDQWAIIEKLNRADASHLVGLEQLVVPTVWLDELAYSPFPSTYAPAAHLPKLLVVDLFAQAFAGYERGSLVQWGPVSTGRDRGATPSGLFFLTWRSRGRHSTVNPEWFMEWYFNFDNRNGLSLHAYDLPGRPASHGCIRLLERDARWLYAWGEGWTLHENGDAAERGTPLLILGAYPFGSPPPWRNLAFVQAGVRLPERLPASIGVARGDAFE